MLQRLKKLKTLIADTPGELSEKTRSRPSSQALITIHTRRIGRKGSIQVIDRITFRGARKQGV